MFPYKQKLEKIKQKSQVQKQKMQPADIGSDSSEYKKRKKLKTEI